MAVFKPNQPVPLDAPQVLVDVSAANPLPAGANRFQLVVVDDAGNVSEPVVFQVIVHAMGDAPVAPVVPQTVRWSDWASFGKPGDAVLGRPVVQRNQDGRLEAFAFGPDGLFSIAQSPPNAAPLAWFDHGKPAANVGIRALAVGRNADGRQEAFVIGDDNALWQHWQVAPNGGWSGWKLLGKPPGDVALADRLAAGIDQDGRQTVFVTGSDGNLWLIGQTAQNGAWSPWQALGRPAPGIRDADRLARASNADGRQELCAIGQDDALWHLWQITPNGAWSGWASLGKPRDAFDGSEPPKARDLSQPLLQQNADGHLDVLAPGSGAFCNRWQETWSGGADKVVWRHQGWNAEAGPRADIGIAWMETAVDFDKRLTVLAIATDGALWSTRTIDTPPFWNAWESLGSPPPKLRGNDLMALGVNADKHLEVFAIGQDGALWHVWQSR
ncbi:hypothetical protein AWB81_05371 [Caballeronia arationis]|uniref:hypothetical protein n=1 Tax=Caballeronia arationis TaxID=1777142 RepID=UPI00074C7310|nr:hypothetical protein [Caballeronia arationis]SAK96278.1 hypothetical protein AWB81_05371 [Caballeronia arationis]